MPPSAHRPAAPAAGSARAAAVAPRRETPPLRRPRRPLVQPFLWALVVFTAASPARGQGFSIIDPPAPPPLTPPPLWERWLFESPWTLMALLIGVGAGLSWVLARRGRPRAGVPAIAGVIASLTAYALAALVTTDREAVDARTRRLIAAVVTGNTEGPGGVADILADDCVLVAALPVLDAASLHKPTILLRAAAEFGPNARNGVGEAAVLESQASDDGLAPNAMRVQVKVRVRAQAWSFPVLSWWRLEWRRDRADGVWRAVGIQALSASGVR